MSPTPATGTTSVKCTRPRKIPLLVEFEFRTLGKRIFGSEYVHQQAAEDLVLQAEDSPPNSSNAQLDLPVPIPFKQLTDFKLNYACLEDPDAIRTMVEELRTAGTFAFDTETTSLNPHRAELVGCSFSAKAQSGYYVPASDTALEILRPLFADPKLKLIGHNLKFDLAILFVNDCAVAGTCHDTLLAHSLLEPSQRHGLDTLAENHLSYSPIPFSDLFPSAKKGDDLDFSQVDPQRLAEYAIEDADIALQLWEKFEPLLKNSGQEKIFSEIEMPLSRCSHRSNSKVSDSIPQAYWKSVRPSKASSKRSKNVSSMQLGANLISIPLAS